MHIDYVVLRNFGSIKHLRVVLNKGLNVITGVNGTGKTQIFGAFVYVLYGKRAMKITNDSTNEICSVVLSTTHDDVVQTHEYVYSDRKYKYIAQHTNADPVPLDTHHGIQSHYHTFKPIFITRDLLNENEIKLTEADIDYFSCLVSQDRFASSFFQKIVDKSILPLLKNGNKGMKKLLLESSIGVTHILRLLTLLASHRKLDYEAPLIMDEVLGTLDYESLNFVLLLFEKYAQTSQVIFFSHRNDINNSRLKILSLPIPVRGSSQPNSPIYYNYNFLLSRRTYSKSINNTSPIGIDLGSVRYIKDSTIELEEHRLVEFKEVKGSNPVNSIISVVDQYVVSYLNESSSTAPGQIFWGITDDTRKIVGISLNHIQRDELRKKISEKLGQIQPPIPPSIYKIELHKVHDNNLQQIQNLYILEVIVLAHHNRLLYSTSRNEVYIKTDGGKKKLSLVEIQEETLLRNKS